MSLGKRADAPGEEWLPKVRNSLNTFALDSTVSTTPIRGSEASSNRFEPSVPRDERQIFMVSIRLLDPATPNDLQGAGKRVLLYPFINRPSFQSLSFLVDLSGALVDLGGRFSG